MVVGRQERGKSTVIRRLKEGCDGSYDLLHFNKRRDGVYASESTEGFFQGAIFSEIEKIMVLFQIPRRRRCRRSESIWAFGSTENPSKPDSLKES